MFEAFDPISVISALSAFTLTCDSSAIHESVDTWLFDFIIKGSSAAALNARLRLKPTSSSSTHKAKDGMLRAYSQLGIYLLQAYAADDVIAETGDALTR